LPPLHHHKPTMSVASAILELVKNGEHDAAIKLIEFDRKRLNDKKFTSGHQLHLSNANLTTSKDSSPEILPTGEIRKLIEGILSEYPAGYELSSYDIFRELEIVHHKRNVFTKKDLDLDSEGKPRWKPRARNALKQIVVAGHLTKISQKIYKVEVW